MLGADLGANLLHLISGDRPTHLNFKGRPWDSPPLAAPTPHPTRSRSERASFGLSVARDWGARPLTPAPTPAPMRPTSLQSVSDAEQRCVIL